MSAIFLRQFGSTSRLALRHNLPRSVPCLQFSSDNQEDSELRTGPRSMVHFKLSPNRHPMGVEKKPHTWENPIKHSVYTEEEVNSIKETHVPVQGARKLIAHSLVWGMRTGFDFISGYHFGKMTEKKWLTRMIFLETAAGVPGMCAGMMRHLTSLRRMERDHGWIHTLLEEAENERMHLLTFLRLREPGPFFRASVLLTQGVLMNAFFLSYAFTPKTCHRFVGYLEEEAVRTYTHCLDEIDNGDLQEWQTKPAPAIAIDYWKLGEEAVMRDVILAVRADEANHRDVNHTFASMKSDSDNPFIDSH